MTKSEEKRKRLKSCNVLKTEKRSGKSWRREKMQTKTRRKKDSCKAMSKNKAQLEVIKELKKELAATKIGAAQLKQIVDALIIRCAVKYGKKEKDENGNVLGYRLVLPNELCQDVIDKYEMRSEKRGDKMIIGVVPRDDEAQA